MDKKRISFAKESTDQHDNENSGVRTENEESGTFQKLSSAISDKIGDTFYRIGFSVASNPWRTILISLFCVALCCLGFLKFYNERNPIKLWIPKNSKFLHDTEWLMKNFEEGHREQTIIFHAPNGNILEPKYLLKILQINQEIENFHVTIKNGTVISWNDVCFKVPLIAEYVTREDRKKRDLFDFMNIFSSKKKNTTIATKERVKKKKPFNPSVSLNTLVFCTIVNSLKEGCLQDNVLEIWKNDPKILENLTLDDVLRALNTTKNSPVTGHQLRAEPFLSGVVRNSSGYITSANTLMENWYVYLNFSEVDHNEIGNLAGTEDWATETVQKWEDGFLNVLHRLKEEMEDDDFKFYYSAGRSYGDISAAVMFQDIDKLLLGGCLMFVYMQIVLSKFNWVELRLILASLGLLSIGLAFLASCGFCSLIGIFYGPVHTSLPFLLMGLGVDDIFVMMACWRKIQSSVHYKESIPVRIGWMLKHAGVSITVTSITDLVAFMVGATTVLPSLQSFCLYAGIGVLFTYLLAITLFVATFTLDEQRIEARRNALIPCIVHSPVTTKHHKNGNLMDKSLRFIYSKIILTIPGKIMVLLLVVVYTGFGISGLLQLEQKFDPTWFIPETTYLSKFFAAKKEFYPEMGYEADIYMGNLNYSRHMPELIEISEKLKNETDILNNYISWIDEFNEFVKVYYEVDMATDNISDSNWRYYLSKFMYSNDGGKYQANIRFAEPLRCGKNVPDINVAYLQFKFKQFKNRAEYLPAMKTIEHILAEANITNNDPKSKANNYSTVWGKVFGNWITDEIIDEEVLRNICLALICVMACTIILIVNFQVCFWIFVCVLLTLVNVGGFMHIWGLTIDLVSCIGLQLAVGLCVDYAAHIGHTFLTVSDGTRTERAIDTVVHIGAAVLHGGGSTILALSMLSNSDAYTFKSFFKIFLLVILFGLFHGVVFLPVILSLIGPRPYSTKVRPVDVQKCDEANDGADELLDLKKRETSNGNGLENHFKNGNVSDDKH